MKNILFIAHSGYKGGAQYVLEYVVRVVYATNAFQKTHLVYPKTHGNAFKNLFNESLITVKPMYFFVSPINFLYQILIFFLNIPSFFQIAAYVIRNKIDLIYINSSVNLMPLILAYLMKRKTIFHIHENSNDLLRMTPTYTRWIYRLAFRSNNIHTIFVSTTSKNLWEKDLDIGFKNSKYSILYSPIKQLKVHYTFNKSSSQVTLGFVGSITKEKNIDKVLHALSIIQTSKSNIKYNILICGDGPERKKLSELANDLNLSNQISFISSVDNVELFFSQIDILVNPSINESWGLVALEAMISQKPVIMTNRSGIKEFFLDQLDCLYFDPMYPHDLALKILLLESTDFRQRIVKNAFNKIENYNFNDVFDKKLKELLF